MNSPSLPAASSLEVFPKRWQDVCRQTLTLICELNENCSKQGRPMGMTKLRHKIMADFDTWEGNKRVPEQSLMREDLEHWMNGKYLSITKFQYIDYWIRKNRNSYDVSRTLSAIIDYTEESYRKALTNLYTAKSDPLYEEIEPHLSKLSGIAMYSEVLKLPKYALKRKEREALFVTKFRQIAVYFRSHDASSISLTVVYLRSPLSELRSIPERRDCIVCFGYLTIARKNDFFHPTLSGPVHVFRDILRGEALSGTSVSECRISLRDWDMSTSWFPQMAAQQNYRGEENNVEIPPLEQSDGPTDSSRNGIRQYYKAPFDDGKFISFVQTLQNRYLIW